MILPAIIGGLGFAKGIYDTISASKRQKQYQAELDAYQRQELTNKYKEMQISTIGSDMMREESSRNIATAMNSVGNAGTRAIIGATQKTVAEQNNVDKNIQIELDGKIEKRDYAIAQDDAQIRGMQEQRENADLAGLGNAIDTARQDANMGMNTMLNGAMAIGTTDSNTSGGNGGNYANTFKSSNYSVPQSIGLTPSSSMFSPSSYPIPSPIGMQPKSNQFDLYQYMNSLKPVKF